VSHDLRSPLVAIKGAVQILEMTDGMPSVTSKFLNMIIRSVNRLDENVQEILECSRNSRLDVNLTTFNLKALLDSVIEDLNFFMGRAVHVVLQGNADSFIVTDKSRLSTVLKNLIGNAVKYSKPDNEDIKVVVKVDLKPDLLSMDVIDEGIGIPEQSLKSIFDMFYRATTISKGTGLGLYICSQIVEKLDGQISVTSTLGVGSKFSISVPLQTKSYENSFGG
jgi:signal transduction histidine kinase